jgi:outer membrane murein-binding lipoprotein Lpp
MKQDRLALAVFAVVCWLSAGAARGAEEPNVPQRVAALEQQVGQLTELVKAQAQALQAAQQSNSELKAKLNDVDWTAAKAAVMKDADKKGDVRQNIWSNLDVQLYGKIKADAAFDTSRTDTGNYARWVEHESTNHNDHQMNITANETRLGLKFNGPNVGEAKTSGLVEFDFFGGGAENKSTPMMRHAYMQMDWADLGLSLLAGQTWDVISPLNPPVLNYSVQWWAGNIGYRRPQVRLTKVCDLGGGTSLKLETAVARDIGRPNGTTGFDPGDSGEDSGLPCFQGRASLTFPFLADKKATIGASGHYAREEYDTDATGRNATADSWSANMDMDLPILSWLSVKGEMFTGQDLDAYLGGIGQGVRTAVNGSPIVANGRLTEVHGTGGWIAASLGPWGPWSFNVGCSGEFIDDGDVTSATARTCNSAIFGNAMYKINANTSVGVEVSRWRTEYKGKDPGDSLRVQTSFIYQF